MIELSDKELAFGKRLAHVEVRDVAVAKLGEILSTEDEFTYMEMLRQWKALFYCFWLSDMPLVQQELSWDLANMILKCKGSNRTSFVRAFWETVCREWYDIDKHRVDKYLLLMRRIVFFTTRSMYQSNWDDQLVSEYMGIYSQFPVSPNDSKIPHTARLHVADVFVDELVRLSAEILKESEEPEVDLAKIPVAKLLEPFMRFVGSSSIRHLPPKIAEAVFENIVMRIAEAEDRAAGAQEEEAGEEGEEQEEEEDDYEPSSNDAVILDNQIENASLRNVQFLIDSIPSVKERLFAVASEESMLSMGRKRLYALYQMLCETFPDDENDVPLPGQIAVREPMGAEGRKIAKKYKRKAELKKAGRKQKKKDLSKNILSTEAATIDINALEKKATADEESKFLQDIAKIREMEKRAGFGTTGDSGDNPKSKKDLRAEKKEKQKQKQQKHNQATKGASNASSVQESNDVPQLIPISEPAAKPSSKASPKTSTKQLGAASVDSWVVQDKTLSATASSPGSRTKRRRNSDQSMLAEALKNIVVKEKTAVSAASTPSKKSPMANGKHAPDVSSKTPESKPGSENGAKSASDKKRLTWALERNSVKRFLKKVPMLPSTEEVSTAPEHQLKPVLRKQSSYGDVQATGEPPLKPISLKQTKGASRVGVNGQTSNTLVRGNKKQKNRR
ncbi:hypothetical protein FB639_000740 [Coemansia asiatica]|nr:hypothetical protein FB639_000740 [Coemansia asiatica]